MIIITGMWVFIGVCAVVCLFTSSEIRRANRTYLHPELYR